MAISKEKNTVKESASAPKKARVALLRNPYALSAFTQA